MTKHLRQNFDWSRAEMVAVYDELTLWSAMAGLLLLEHVPLSPGAQLLDVGCGTGFPLLELAQRLGPSCAACGLDPWKAALDRARQKIDRLGIRGVTLIEGDACAMPLEAGRFDLIVSNLGVNNFADPAGALAECFRVAAPGAALAVSSNLRGHMQMLYNIYESTLREIGRQELVDRLGEHVKQRVTLEGLSAQVHGAGFAVRRTVQSQAAMRFADGSALLRHSFIRIAFLGGWRNVVDEQDRPAVFERLEANLNKAAAEQGELRLEIPLGYVEAVKA